MQLYLLYYCILSLLKYDIKEGLLYSLNLDVVTLIFCRKLSNNMSRELEFLQFLFCRPLAGKIWHLYS